MLTPDELERFEDKIEYEPMSGCWLWAAAVGNGYGRFSLSRKRAGGRLDVRAHRVAYEVWVGPIPNGLELDHLCRVRCCVNPAHLEPVTHQENVSRGLGGQHQARKTHCPKGHPYVGGNLKRERRPDGGMKRLCRECLRESQARYNQRREPKYPSASEAPLRLGGVCPKGHPFDVGNTLMERSGARRCRKCNRERLRHRRAARRWAKLMGGGEPRKTTGGGR